jgi:RNA polymerase sigma-70 factor (ECF subfamily)
VAGLLQDGEGNHVLSSSYLWKVAYTATIDEIRRQRRRNEVALEEGADGPATAPALDPERTRSAREIGEALQSCLGVLAEPRRLAVTLHLLGHSVPEAGRILGWESKRVENLVYRGLADLRRCLEGKGVRP